MAAKQHHRRIQAHRRPVAIRMLGHELLRFREIPKWQRRGRVLRGCVLHGSELRERFLEVHESAVLPLRREALAINRIIFEQHSEARHPFVGHLVRELATERPAGLDDILDALSVWELRELFELALRAIAREVQSLALSRSSVISIRPPARREDRNYKYPRT